MYVTERTKYEFPCWKIVFRLPSPNINSNARLQEPVVDTSKCINTMESAQINYDIFIIRTWVGRYMYLTKQYISSLQSMASYCLVTKSWHTQRWLLTWHSIATEWNAEDTNLDGFCANNRYISIHNEVQMCPLLWTASQYMLYWIETAPQFHGFA
jgi:hypothetical protein